MVEKKQLVETEAGQVTVRPLVFADYFQIIQFLQKPIAELAKNADDLPDDPAIVDILNVIGKILPECQDEIAAIIAVATDKDAKFIQGLDGADTIEVIDAVLQLNDVARIWKAIKKVMARTTPGAADQKKPQ